MPMAMASGKLVALRMVDMLRRARSVNRESKESTAALIRLKLLVMTGGIYQLAIPGVWVQAARTTYCARRVGLALGPPFLLLFRR